jgi:hypothetical protein
MQNEFSELSYPLTVIISEGESKSEACQYCKERQGRYLINSAAELEKLEKPPYHPNCACKMEIIESAQVDSEEHGTTLEMEDVAQKAKKIFEDLNERYYTIGSEVILNWWITRILGDKSPDMACRQRAAMLLDELKSQIPAREWVDVRHVRGYFPNPNAGLNVSHSWVELRMQYIDEYGVHRKVRVKFDPYYKKWIF